MTILIDLSVAGINTGPFNLYSDADDYTSAFALNVTRQQLLDGYPAVVTAGTTNIKLQSLSDICPNDTILPVSTTTSTTSTSTSSTTTTTTTIPSVTIGTQTWTTKNLDVETYNDGTPIPHVTNPEEWRLLETGAWCYVNNDPNTEAIYGKLYNWYAVNDSRGLAPINYHIPTQTEFNTLITTLGGNEFTGEKLKSTGTIEGNDGYWYAPNYADNSSLFNAFPAGERYGQPAGLLPDFVDVGYLSSFWSSTPKDSENAYSIIMYNSITDAFEVDRPLYLGLQVRLIKD